MPPSSLPTLRRLQGRHVAVALFDGTRLDDEAISGPHPAVAETSAVSRRPEAG